MCICLFHADDLLVLLSLARTTWHNALEVDSVGGTVGRDD